MLSNVACANRAEEGIGNGMRQDISIGMAFQTASARNLDAAEDQFPAFAETVNIVSNTGAGHGQIFRSITPFEATTLNLSFMSGRVRMSTFPPAVSIKIQPAAI